MANIALKHVNKQPPQIGVWIPMDSNYLLRQIGKRNYRYKENLDLKNAYAVILERFSFCWWQVKDKVENNELLYVEVLYCEWTKDAP